MTVNHIGTTINSYSHGRHLSKLVLFLLFLPLDPSGLYRLH